MSFRLALLIFLCVVSRLAAEKIGWHPELVLELGRGTDLRNQDAIKPAVAIMSATPSDNPVTGGAIINVRYVQHEFDLAKSFSLNASLSAKNKMSKGKVGFALADSYKSSGNTVSFVFECDRNFGDKLYAVTGLAPNFVATVNELKQVLSGTALHKAVTDRFGSHFVSGQQKTAKAVVIYTLTYESQSTARSRALNFGLDYNAGISELAFQTAIKDEMSRSDSRVSLNYQFYSSDPFVLPDFPVTARISTFDEFLTYTAKVETYCKAMNPANAKDVAYIVEPLQNLPGYLQLLGGFSPDEYFSTNYDRFLATYAEFKGWEEQLFQWSGDARRMSWLNLEGQKIVLGMRADASRYVKQLEDIAKRHFQDGAPLLVSEEITNYRVNFNKIPIPQIRQSRFVAFDPVGNGSIWLVWIGSVDSGLPALSVDRAFRTMVVLTDGAETGRSWDVLYDANVFAASQPHYPTSFPWSQERFAEFLASPVWTNLRTDASGKHVGFVAGALAFPPGFDLNRISLGVKNAAGEIAEAVPLLASGPGISSQSVEGATQTDLHLSSIFAASVGIVGSPVDYRLAITNAGPGSAFGVSVAFQVPTGFELVNAGGSQGSGTVTSGTLTYQVGSMAYGATANIRFSLIPKQVGRLELPSPLELGTGDGLTDPNLTDNRLSLAALEVVEPRLVISSNAGLVELRWQSAAGRFAVEQSTALNSPTWSLPSGVASTDGDTSMLKISPAMGQRFFRLRVQ